MIVVVTEYMMKGTVDICLSAIYWSSCGIISATQLLPVEATVFARIEWTSNTNWGLFKFSRPLSINICPLNSQAAHTIRLAAVFRIMERNKRKKKKKNSTEQQAK